MIASNSSAGESGEPINDIDKIASTGKQHVKYLANRIQFAKKSLKTSKDSVRTSPSANFSQKEFNIRRDAQK